MKQSYAKEMKSWRSDCFDQKELLVVAGEGALSLKVVRPAGKPKMSITDFLNGAGRQLKVGDHFEIKQMNAREQIVRVLEEVFEQGAYSNIALNQALEHSQLSDKDRSFVTEVVYGTVARKITLEWYLAHVIEDRTKLDPWLYYLLMMSLYQLVYLDRIPDHAIVNEAVRIAKRRKEGSEKFVNAILRKSSSARGLPAIDTIKRKNKRYSVEYSLPVWLVKALIEEYGEERAC